ncbi:hypothetical protein [Actinopolymorpha pittospori]|uniref:Uncharacterized protein n=1 Tax=Actinopolymorpha pittospori TaxID=648752 RepID=A0A927RL22_9ACTN|nr:hypothetical protein [Actinopolymorpha pittospori]MBE1607338.1 hypothetical protein [Actinopolymorpha pittospori]
MSDPDLRVFAGVAWPALNHRQARTRLETHGWVKCGEGDWAVALRSPGAALAARISAFEPSYAWFLELCRRAEGSPYLPRIDFASELEGGGHLTVLEYLAPVEAAEETAFLQRWHDGADPDPDLRQLRRLVEALDRECREYVPFWMGIDLEDHVLRSADGRLKLIDLLGVAGGLILDQIHADMDEFLRLMPRDRCRYILEIPHFTREYAARQRAQLVADLVAYGLET